MQARNPFFYLSIALLLLIVGAGSYKLGRKGESGPARQNPIIAIYNTLSPQARALYYKQSDELTKSVPERLVELDQKTIGCFGASQVLAASASDENFGGQCCGVLKDVRSYELQLKALRRFIEENGDIDLIPRDPYDLPVVHAQQLARFDQEIVLSSEQQQLFDDAIQMSHHGGPCCCKCWKWYVMSGLAKKLIVDEGWDALRIVQLWDLSSSCGHAADTNMYEHYDV